MPDGATLEASSGSDNKKRSRVRHALCGVLKPADFIGVDLADPTPLPRGNGAGVAAL
jgi:hypothetical protein